MFPRQIARILTPCCLLAGCAGVPELPADSAMHPAHPDAQMALTGDRPSILDAMAMDIVEQPHAMDAGEMEHPHSMSMGDEPQGQSDHSHHDMSMSDEEEDPSEDPGDDGDNGLSDQGADDEG